MEAKPKDSYYQRNREAVLARRKARRAADPERYRVAGRLQMARWRATNPRVSAAHGLPLEEVGRRLQAQGGACLICKATEARWHGDHDHATGYFRGVLCNKCNMGLGLFNDNPELLAAAHAYLRRQTDIQTLL